MKKSILLVWVVSAVPFFSNCFGQVNLVPNPSFEDTSYCVSSPGEMPSSQGWNSYLNSPDYFNPCTSDSFVSVPYNWGGYQQPSSGIAYCALGTYSSSFGQINGREFIGRDLSEPLTIGAQYYVSFKTVLSVSPAIWSNCATNNLGAGFTNTPHHWSTAPLQVTNNPKVYCDSIITDTLNWVTVFGSFTADSAYQYIVLGNLFNDVNTDTLIVNGSSATNCFAYYYIDDVCVSTDSMYAANFLYTSLEDEPLENRFNVYPNPISDLLLINNDSKEQYDIRVYNSLGQVLYQEENIYETNKQIEVSTFSKGLLIINIKSNNKVINYKLLKQ